VYIETEVRMRSDAELLGSAEASAFRELYDRYSVRIYRFQLGRTRDVDAALELTAETFAQAWLSRARFRDLAGGSAGPWLYGIARHVLVASVRKRRLERRAVDRLGALLGRDDQDEVVPTPLWLEGLDEAIAELPADVRRALELRVVDELPYDDVAREMQTTAGAARVRVHRGLSALRSRFLRTEEATR
jgi:RNA polymerase sigma-70 factor (ECF subfamily)